MADRVGRLAIRQIKDEVRAYYAMPDTVRDAVLLGTIKAGILRRNRAHFDAFLALMRGAVADIWRGLRRKGVVEKDGPWARLSEVGLEAWRQLEAQRRQEGEGATNG